MKVTLIASTQLRYTPESIQGTPFGGKFWNQAFSETQHGDIDTLAELAGRSCYESWSMPNKATADTEGYLHNIIEQGHFSVLEHGSATFYIEGVSRSLTHELIRHRHLSYSELSQRYVNMEEADFVIPPAVRSAMVADGMEPRETTVAENCPEAVAAYTDLVIALEKSGITGKKAREAARCVMPNGTETKIVVTGNLRAWRDFLHKRWHVAADAEIRQLAGEILKHLREIAPHSVQDIKEAPFQ